MLAHRGLRCASKPSLIDFHHNAGCSEISLLSRHAWVFGPKVLVEKRSLADCVALDALVHLEVDFGDETRARSLYASINDAISRKAECRCLSEDRARLHWAGGGSDTN